MAEIKGIEQELLLASLWIKIMIISIKSMNINHFVAVSRTNFIKVCYARAGELEMKTKKGYLPDKKEGG